MGEESLLAEEPESEKAPRKFGMATATFVVVASMVGTGVLTTSGFTVFSTGSNQLMLVVWVVGGLVALCGALSVAELSAALPHAGGDYVFLYRSYGPLAAFLSGWVSFLIGFGGPIAVSAAAAGKYLVGPLGLEGSYLYYATQGIATVAILALAVVHTSGQGPTMSVQAATTLLKLGILGLLALAGIWAGWGRWSHLSDRPSMNGDVVKQMFFSLVYVSYAYTGWNAAGYLAGEVDQAQKRLPRAIMLGTGVVLALYLALNLFYALALSAEDVARIVSPEGGKTDPGRVAPIAWLAAEQLFGKRFSSFLSVAIGLTLLASLSAFVLTGPRVAFAMARAGQFPEIAGRLSKRTGTPTIATWMQVSWSLLLLWTGSFESLLMYSGVGLAMFSMLTVSAVYVLRWKSPDLPRPFRVPGYPWMPMMFLVPTGLLTAAAFSERPMASLAALGSILIGIPLYYVSVVRGRRASEVVMPGE